MTRAAVLLLIMLMPAAATAAWWNGFAAPPTGQGLNGDPRVLHLYGDDLYAGGVEAWFVARWDGSAWHDVDGGTDNRIDAMCIYDGDLIAGGRFTEAGGVTAESVAAWDGLAWSPIGAASWNWGYVLSLAENEGNLYAGGTGFVARWDGVVWQEITGTGFTGDVFALAAYDKTIYAGGAFSALVNPGGGTVAATNMAYWNGDEWLAVDGGTNGTVYALELHGDDLAAGGVFSSPGNLIAAWNGASWYEPGGGLVGSYVIALESLNGLLIAGGDFTGGGAISMTRIGILDGGDWAALGDGVNGMVRTIAVQGNAIFAGGAFDYAGGLPSQHMGRWDDPDVGVGEPLPANTLLRMPAPFPNPANPGVTIPVRLDGDAHVTIEVYDLAGHRVRRLWDGVLPAGDRAFTWDGTTDTGRPAPSGAYVARAITATETTSRPFALVR